MIGKFQDGKFVRYDSGGVSIDDELSLESKNPVMNKVIAEKFNEIEKTITDIKSNGVGGGSSSGNENGGTCECPTYTDEEIIKAVNEILFPPIIPVIPDIEQEEPSEDDTEGETEGDETTSPETGEEETEEPVEGEEEGES